jgi:hypothetical protein
MPLILLFQVKRVCPRTAPFEEAPQLVLVGRARALELAVRFAHLGHEAAVNPGPLIVGGCLTISHLLGEIFLRNVRRANFFPGGTGCRPCGRGRHRKHHEQGRKNRPENTLLKNVAHLVFLLIPEAAVMQNKRDSRPGSQGAR